MSLILDALRKADADRSRGEVPGLHAQPVLAAQPQAKARTAAWRWAAAGLAAGLAIAVALSLLGRNASEPAAGPVTGVPSAAPTTAETDRSAAAPPPQAAAERRAEPEPSAMRAEPAPWPQPTPRPQPDRAAAEPSAAAATRAPPAPGPDRLPDALRAQLPPLTLGGSIYSSNPASRSLIVNGRLHRESDLVAPGLRLEEIKPNGAVFDFNGQRFELTQ